MPPRDDRLALPADSRTDPRGRAVALVAALVLLAAVAAGGRYLLGRRPAAAPVAPTTADRAFEAGRPAPDAALPPAPSAAAAATSPPASPAAASGGHLLRVVVTVDGALERNVVQASGHEVGPALTQVLVRALVWWVSVPGELRPGDTIEALYEPRAGDEPLLHAVRFTSARLGRRERAYRFQPAGGRFARFYQPDGSELELRLKDPPLDDYEQVTSRLRDGRGHRGVDFKAPVGTAVRAPFAGTIARRTWSFRMNGNSLELRDSAGARSATFLHLSEIAPEARVGAKVARGQRIARSGNTGHSFAPHLHYQLSRRGGAVLDPFLVQATERRALPAAELSGFREQVRRLDALLDGGPPAPER